MSAIDIGVGYTGERGSELRAIDALHLLGIILSHVLLQLLIAYHCLEKLGVNLIAPIFGAHIVQAHLGEHGYLFEICLIGLRLEEEITYR